MLQLANPNDRRSVKRKDEERTPCLPQALGTCTYTGTMVKTKNPQKQIALL
jgi:hypothetical protein